MTRSTRRPEGNSLLVIQLASLPLVPPASCQLWVSIDPRDLQRAFAVWWQPDYARLELDGVLANAFQPWGLRRVLLRLPGLAPGLVLEAI